MADSWGGELPGVQVGDVLHDLLKALNVISLQTQRRLVGVKLHLERDRETYIHLVSLETQICLMKSALCMCIYQCLDVKKKLKLILFIINKKVITSLHKT